MYGLLVTRCLLHFEVSGYFVSDFKAQNQKSVNYSIYDICLTTGNYAAAAAAV